MSDPQNAGLPPRIIRWEDGESRLARLRARRLSEDERLVCMERARILHATRHRYADRSRVARQASILRDLCEQITPVIEEEDVLVGRMPEVLPSPEEEQFVEAHPELFTQPGVPGWLDSISIHIPDWEWLLEAGLGGIAAEAQRRLDLLPNTDEDRREFLTAAIQGLEAVATLLRRYAAEARRLAELAASEQRRLELEEIAARCERVAWEAPTSFLEGLQLLQIVHMVFSCLIGGRDVTPGRLDRYLLQLYRQDLTNGTLDRDEAAVLLAMFFLRLSQTGGNATDFDDNLRRSPCRYTHLYVTVGGTDSEGNDATNELSFLVLDAIQLLHYKEPTVVVRYREDMADAFKAKVAELIRGRFPVTIYNDDVVLRALTRQGVPSDLARGYAHCACHNVTVPGHEAGTGVGGFHNLPQLLLLAMNGGRDAATATQVGAPTPPPTEIESFEQFWEALGEQVRSHLANARQRMDDWWRREFAGACPLLQSCLMRESIARGEPAWRAARVSHLNHYLMGLGTTVDSLTAIRGLVFEQHELQLDEFAVIVAANWQDREELRRSIPRRFPRYGQDDPESRELAARLGEMWVEEVEAASHGMTRLQMWPGFYSHAVHVHEGKRTPATPDGRRAGDPLSENQGPSAATPFCSPTTILNAMADLPLDHTPSGATTLALAPSDIAGEAGTEKLLALIESYFGMGGLQLHVNVVDADTLEEAMRVPERHSQLMVRVAGYSAYFTRLSRDLQEDIVRRHRTSDGRVRT
jgi:pyruvate-formate lyase